MREWRLTVVTLQLDFMKTSRLLTLAVGAVVVFQILGCNGSGPPVEKPTEKMTPERKAIIEKRKKLDSTL